MLLTNPERAFIEKRRWFARTWSWVGSGMLAALVVFAVWLFLTQPLLNPWQVMARVEAETISEPTLAMMAALLPVAIGLCLLLAGVALLFAFAAFANERKYLAIIDRLSSSRDFSSKPVRRI